MGDNPLEVAALWLGNKVLGLIDIRMGLPAFLTALLDRQKPAAPPGA